jgi:hypothetical protein
VRIEAAREYRHAAELAVIGCRAPDGQDSSSDLTGAKPTDALWPQQAAVLLWQLLQHAAAQLQHPARITASAASSPGRARHVRQFTILGDRAAWIWGIAGAKFPEAIQIVDLFHAREHLHDLGKLLAFMLADQHTSPPGLAG